MVELTALSSRMWWSNCNIF